MTDEPLINQADIDLLCARDARWKAINLAIRVDEELRNSATVNLILNALQRRSTEAMEALLTADPLDTRRIAALQEQIKGVRYIGNELQAIRDNGLMAQAMVEEEGNVDLHN